MPPEHEALFARAAFVASAGNPAQFPAPDRPEIAFVGRSNVGKSSAINAITGRKRLAFAAKAPGRTQTVNFYDVGEAGRFVDLPGYGYARVPQAVRAGWERLVGSYLGERISLAGAVVLMDARHPLTPQDERLLEWLAPLTHARLVLLTKADKLSRAAAKEALRAVCRKLDADPGDVVLFSSTSGTGVEEVRERLAQWLRAGGSGSRK